MITYPSVLICELTRVLFKLQQRVLTLRTRSGTPPAQACRSCPAPTDPRDPWDPRSSLSSPPPSQKSWDRSSRGEPRALKWRSSQDRSSRTSRTSLWRPNRSLSMWVSQPVFFCLQSTLEGGMFFSSSSVFWCFSPPAGEEMFWVQRRWMVGRRRERENGMAASGYGPAADLCQAVVWPQGVRVPGAQRASGWWIGLCECLLGSPAAILISSLDGEVSTH